MQVLGFKRTIFWNEYRSKITTQPKNNNLDYIVGSTFRNINRLFVFWFKKGDNDSTRNHFDKYHLLLVTKKDFNAFIDNKLVLVQFVRNRQEAYEKRVEISGNGDYAIGVL